MLMLIWALCTLLLAAVGAISLLVVRHGVQARKIDELKMVSDSLNRQMGQMKDQAVSRSSLVNQMRYVIGQLEERLHYETRHKATKYSRGQLPRMAQRILDDTNVLPVSRVKDPAYEIVSVSKTQETL